jgi:Flp pilus assembly protein TadD
MGSAACPFAKFEASSNLRQGNKLWAKGDRNGAIAEYRRAEQLNPANGAVHVALGWALIWTNGDTDEAIKEESSAIKLDPGDAKAHFGLGFAFEAKGNLCGALAQYHIAYTLGADSDAKINYERLEKAHLNCPPAKVFPPSAGQLFPL